MQANIGFSLTRNSRKHGSKIAIIYRGKRITYGQLNARVNRLANALMANGIRKGMKVALIFNNSNEFVESIYATFKIGGVAVPINARLNPREMYNLIDHSDSSTLIFDKSFLEQVESIRQKSQKVNRYIIVDDKPRSGFLNYESILKHGSSSEPEGVKVEEPDEACIIYTAGTTGDPKGVLLTHRNFLWLSVNYCIGRMTSFEDISMYVFPLFHIGGLTTFSSHIFIGGTAFLKEKYDLLDCLETIQKEGINRWSAIPSIYADVVNFRDIHNYNLSSIRKISSGAAPMPMEVKKRLPEIFPNADFFDGYGQTESTGAITQLSPQDAFRKPGSVGLPYPTNEIRVIDDRNKDVGIGEVGELVYDGPTRMKSYYKDPESTRMTVEGGWMRSGDLVKIDEEGYVYLVGRKKDMIITGGENVYPREVEETIAKLPQVAEVAVIGLPDPKWGEAVTAIVVVKAGTALSEREVIRFCKDQIAGFKSPKKVIFAESLPKTSVGKVLKRNLVKLYIP
jgi:acyl-CoA synthetase (AMP-forming)/AMP-acid ligase II